MSSFKAKRINAKQYYIKGVDVTQKLKKLAELDNNGQGIEKGIMETNKDNKIVENTFNEIKDGYEIDTRCSNLTSTDLSKITSDINNVVSKVDTTNSSINKQIESVKTLEADLTGLIETAESKIKEDMCEYVRKDIAERVNEIKKLVNNVSSEVVSQTSAYTADYIDTIITNSTEKELESDRLFEMREDYNTKYTKLTECVKEIEDLLKTVSEYEKGDNLDKMLDDIEYPHGPTATGNLTLPDGWKTSIHPTDERVFGEPLEVNSGTTIRIKELEVARYICGGNYWWDVVGYNEDPNCTETGSTDCKIAPFPDLSTHKSDYQTYTYNNINFFTGNLICSSRMHVKSLRVGRVMPPNYAEGWDFRHTYMGYSSVGVGQSLRVFGDISFAGGSYASTGVSRETGDLWLSSMGNHNNVDQTTDNGKYAFSWGLRTSAFGMGAIALGWNSFSWQDNSFTSGTHSEAYGEESIAIGYGCLAGDWQYKANKRDATDVTAYYETVDQDGGAERDGGKRGIAMGISCYANMRESIALGYRAWTGTVDKRWVAVEVGDDIMFAVGCAPFVKYCPPTTDDSFRGRYLGKSFVTLMFKESDITDMTWLEEAMSRGKTPGVLDAQIEQRKYRGWNDTDNGSGYTVMGKGKIEGIYYPEDTTDKSSNKMVTFVQKGMIILHVSLEGPPSWSENYLNWNLIDHIYGSGPQALNSIGPPKEITYTDQPTQNNNNNGITINRRGNVGFGHSSTSEHANWNVNNKIYDYSTGREAWSAAYPLEVKGIGKCGRTLVTQSGIYAHSITKESDERIKKNIKDIPANQSLQMVRDIGCKYYEYKDVDVRGGRKTIGFIAQQVNTILPMAVNILTGEVIHNEQRISTQHTWESFIDSEENTKYKLTINDLNETEGGILYNFKVGILVGNYEEIMSVVSLVDSPKSFIFDKRYDSIFIYGKSVDDYHTLNKDILFTVNFSATQEIDRIQQAEISKVTALELENIELKNRLNVIEVKLLAKLNSVG